MGHLVDVSPEGVMLISEEPIETRTLFQLKMTLPEEMDQRRELIFNAESLWCRPDANPDFFDTGFRLKDMASGDILLIERLIRSFAMDSE